MGTRSSGNFIRRVMRGVADLVYRDIDINVADSSTLADGPIIAVSNHFGGLSDGVLLLDALPRMPRVVARDLIWKVPVIGQLATALGGIPVHRRADSGDSSNDEMFGSCYEALAAGDLVLIFPEGVTQDVPHMAEVKTGAARIALGARRSGVTGIRVLPIGLHYENKSGFRSRALVNVGDTMDLDAWLGERGAVANPDDKDLVQELTAEIDGRLRLVAPDFPDWDTAHDLELAAEVVLHDVDASSDLVPYGDQSLLAGRLNRLGEPDHSVIRGAASEYRADLADHRVSDLKIAHLAGDVRSDAGRPWSREILLVLVLIPYAIAGVVLWAVPWVIMQAVRLIPIAPAEKATLMPAVAFLAFAIEWGALVWNGFARDPLIGAIALLLPPLFLGAFLLVSERITLLGRLIPMLRRISPDAADRLQHGRQRLSAATWQAL